MDAVSSKDRSILRSLAQKQLVYAHSPENAVIWKKWEALAQGRRETPTVRFLISNFPNEVITPRQQCVGPTARAIEYALLSTMAG